MSQREGILRIPGYEVLSIIQPAARQGTVDALQAARVVRIQHNPREALSAGGCMRDGPSQVGNRAFEVCVALIGHRRPVGPWFPDDLVGGDLFPCERGQRVGARIPGAGNHVGREDRGALGGALLVTPAGDDGQTQRVCE